MKFKKQLEVKMQKRGRNICIPVRCYKHGCNELLPALVLVFHTIIASGEYSSSWVTGIIYHVHKKADHNVPNNYRKVTIMPCIGNLFESLLNNRRSFKNVVCNDNDPFQAGFRSTSPGQVIIYAYYVPL